MAVPSLSCGMQDLRPSLHHVGPLVAACELLVAACRIKFPDQGSNPGPLHEQHGILTTGPPGKPLPTYFTYILLFSTSVAVSGVLQTSHMTGVSQDSTYSCTHRWHLWQWFNKDTQPDHWEKETESKGIHVQASLCFLSYEGSCKAHSSPQEQHVCNAMASLGLSEN